MQLSNYLFFTTDCEAGAGILHRLRPRPRRRHCCGYGAGGMPVPVAKPCAARSCTRRFEGPGVLFYASDNDDAEPMRGSAHILMMDDRAQTDDALQAVAGRRHGHDRARHPALGRLLRQARGSVSGCRRCSNCTVAVRALAEATAEGGGLAARMPALSRRCTPWRVRIFRPKPLPLYRYPV